MSSGKCRWNEDLVCWPPTNQHCQMWKNWLQVAEAIKKEKQHLQVTCAGCRQVMGAETQAMAKKGREDEAENVLD